MRGAAKHAGPWRPEIERLRAINAELVAALKDTLSLVDYDEDSPTQLRARAAIARAKP